MDKRRQHASEQTAINETRQRDRSLRSPDHFYPRPEDIVADDTLSRDEKLELLRNWQTQLQGRAGALEAPPVEREPEDREVAAALQEARQRMKPQ